MRRLLLLSLLIASLLMLSCTHFTLQVAEVDSWLIEKAGDKTPTVNISGKWQDWETDYNYDEKRFNPFGWGTGWGKGAFDQKGKNITGIMGVYVIKGIVSGNRVYLVFISGGSVHYTANFEMIGDNELLGTYYSSSDIQQSKPYPMGFKRMK